MTKKRFTLEERDCYDYGIRVVDIIKDNGTELPQSTACDLLNELVKENEELISIKCFADRHGINIFNIVEAFRKCWNDNVKLIKENEQLKQRINSRLHFYRELYGITNDKVVERVIEDLEDILKR